MIGDIREASSGEMAVEMTAKEPFDLVMMDISLPGISGLEASEVILARSPEYRIIIVTGRLEGAPIRQLLNAGVRGYITKGSSADEIDKAVRCVMRGEQYLSPDVAQQVAMDVIKGDPEVDPFGRLTTREREIVDLILRGRRNREISDSLNISEKTVSTHRTRAFEKLEVTTTAELVRMAIRHDVWNDE